jgi:hypothetical protein
MKNQPKFICEKILLKISKMKKIIFLIIICVYQKLYSQEIIQSRLDSLKKVKNDYAIIITEYEKKINKIDFLIKEIEDKKAIAEFSSSRTLEYVIPSDDIIKFREKDNPNGKLLFQPQKGETLKLINYMVDSKYWLVVYNNITGYINEMYITANPQINEFKKYLLKLNAQKDEEERKLNAQKEEEERKLNAQKEESRQKILAQQRESSLIKKYGSEIAKKILAEKIWLGMTDEMAKESWGNPKDINRSVYTWGVHEQWVYESSTYLYFENGKLTSWQDQK